MAVSKEGLFAAGKIQSRDVEVCGVSVRLRMITARERCDIFATAKDDATANDPAAIRIAMLSRCMVDDSDQQMFNGDADRIMDLPADMVERLFEESLDLNGFGRNRVEEAAKN